MTQWVLKNSLENMMYDNNTKPMTEREILTEFKAWVLNQCYDSILQVSIVGVIEDFEKYINHDEDKTKAANINEQAKKVCDRVNNHANHRCINCGAKPCDPCGLW